MSNHIKNLKEFVQSVAGSDTHKPNEENIETLLSDVEKCVLSFFKGRKNSISPSQTSMTERQLWFTLNGYQDKNPDAFKPETRIKMLVSSVAEHLIVFLMKEAGIEITNQQASTEISEEDAGVEMRGSIDYELDGQIRDFKCTSDENFRTKFRGGPTLAKNDPFGYLAQAELYSRGMGKEFGGWDVFNLNTGAIKSVAASSIKHEMEHQVDFFQYKLDTAREARRFSDLPMCHPIREDGVVAWQCSRCNFVKQCFPDAVNEGEPGMPKYKIKIEEEK